MNNYIPNSNNAHIDTTAFERELEEIAGDYLDEQGEETIQHFYRYALEILNKSPDQPGDSDIICRYFTPKKFMWFAGLKELQFSNPQTFDDPLDCSIPNDYDNGVRKVIAGKYNHVNMSAEDWENYVWREKADWLISCWTLKDMHHDDNLIWHKYADGQEGVGIHIKYKVLRDFLFRKVKNQFNSNVKIAVLFSGAVSYNGPLKILPFNKRTMFSNEKEVRFAFKDPEYRTAFKVNISALVPKMTLAFSQDASEHHIRATRNIWESLGGSDLYFQPDK